ncbi:MAG: response regulator [Patescibacteria group bacterium]
MGKIFIVEDDQYVSRMYERIFRLGGHDVVFATDGESALKVLMNANPLPGVILLDLVLPKKSGLEVLTEVRSDTKYDSIPIAILTNSVHPEEAEKYLALGADKYVIKMDSQAKDVMALAEELMSKGRSTSK